MMAFRRGRHLGPDLGIVTQTGNISSQRFSEGRDERVSIPSGISPPPEVRRNVERITGQACRFDTRKPLV